MTLAGSPIGAARIAFASTVGDCPPPSPDVAVVVLDTAWTPGPIDRSDILPVRPLLNLAIERHDLFEEARALLDAWASAAELPDRLIVDGATYWFRMRETMWRWLHERLLWRHAIGAAISGPLRIVGSVPATELALLDALGWIGGDATIGADPPPATLSGDVGDGARPPTRSVTDRLLQRIGVRRSETAVRADESRRRDAVLTQRISALMQVPGPRIVVLTTPATHARIGSGESSVRRDPYFGSVIPRLESSGLAPILIGLGLNQGSDEDWAAIERDERLLPQSLLRTRWASPGDEARSGQALASCDAALDAARGVPLEVEGVDIAPTLVEALRSSLSRTIATDVRQSPRIGRLIADLRPAAVLLAQEGIRLPWLMAARSAGVPVFAIQHGVLYRTHPGYPAARHPALVLPSCTFVYGGFSRRVLLAGAYLANEVEVSGSPRLDLDSQAEAATSTDAAPALERESIRRSLGVAPSDRLLVVSTVNLEFVRRSHLVHMIERVMGGPLPGVHVVFKQHPGERDEGPYRALVEGLARAGGYAPPPVSVVRDIDLYALLRSADAHLGLHSTVLTDAVAAGTPNLIAIVEGHADLLGYEAAGVAHPVRDVADLRAALADPPRPDAAARRAFLDDHFRPGDASGRIVDAIRGRLG